MARAFNYKSAAIAIGTLPDPNPNTTPPLAPRIFASPAKAESGAPASTVQYAVKMNAAGTVDVTPWVRDATTGTWFKTVTEVGVADKDLLEVVGIAGAEVFFQLTNPAAFATIEVFAESTE